MDAAQVEQGIEDDLSTASASVTSAKCPDDVAVEQGDTFACTVGFDNGASGRATVTQLGVSRYSYELEAGSVQVAGSTAEAAVKKSLAAQGLPDSVVTCPDNIVVKVGTTVTCDLSSNGRAASGASPPPSVTRTARSTRRRSRRERRHRGSWRAASRTLLQIAAASDR